MTKVKPNYLSVLHKLEQKKSRRYKWSEIGERLGMSRQAAHNLFMSDSEKGYLRYETAAALIDFFNDEGLDVNLCDLLTVTPMSSPSPE